MELKEQIILLKSKGKSHKEISKILNCSVSTVSYWCNDMYRKNHLTKTNNNRKTWIGKLQREVGHFKRIRNLCPKRAISTKDWRKRFALKIHEFKRRMKNNKGFTASTLLNSINDPTHIKCYLTGRNIDLTKDDYHLDHIIPVSKGGSCTLDNLGFTCPEANQSKFNLMLDEYLSLCKEVLENFGYTVIKEKD